LNETLKLFVAGYDGVVCIYEVNINDGDECKQISQHLLFSTRTYSANVITNDNATVPLSSTSPATNPTTAKNFTHPSSNIPNDEHNFPRLLSSAPGVYD
ncbi:unnamed protein product, partial [Rotaria sp. Silwood2]